MSSKMLVPYVTGGMTAGWPDYVRAYADAGADAILVHSAKRTPDEVLSFKQAWDRSLPVLAVPTKYCETPTLVFRHHQFAALIWANHLLRASLLAMQAAAAQIFADQCVSRIETTIAPLKEVFRLQRADELESAERRYLADASTVSPAVSQ